MSGPEIPPVYGREDVKRSWTNCLHLVVGTGANGRMQPDPDTIHQLQERGLTVETLPTGQAVRRFGELDPSRHRSRPPPHLLTRGAETANPVTNFTPTSVRDHRRPAGKPLSGPVATGGIASRVRPTG
jgi:Protein of unknown function (DUF498/DUF598)